MSSTDPRHPRHTVTAIVVSHDGARWLGETLDALLRQTRPVDRVVGADNGSRDGSAALLKDALGPNAVLTLPRSTGFGEAVAEVLARLEPVGGREWIWLLHDDCAPDARALETLLRAADQDPKAGVLGPKLRDWLDRRLLLEVGVTVDRTGRRDTGLEPREFDQGQYDGVRDVLSVSTAGMLIRRDVWDEMGGLDPFLPIFRDDLDLCWRVRAAGHRVQNVTRAVAWHAEAASRRRRRITVSGDHPRRLDRRNAIFVVLANLPFWPLVRALLRNVAGSSFRALLFLLAKQPANALDEIVALGSILVHPIRMIRARRARAAGRRQHYAAIERLLTPPGAGYRRLADRVQSYLAGSGFVESAGRHHAGGAAGEDDGDELLTDDAGMMRRVFGNPGVLLFLALALITLIAERGLVGGARLGGGALVPVIGGSADLWALYTEGYHQGGLGSDGWAPPYVAVLAALSSLLFGKTWLAVSVLLLGCVPLAGFSAYAATRSMIPGRWTRVWLASSYALLPVATGAVAAGRLGTAVVFVLLPVYAALATAVLTAEHRRARRAAWALGLALAIGTAFAPLVYPLTLLLGALAALAFPRRGVGVSVTIAFGVPVALLLPWLAEVVADPGRLLLEAGLHRPDLVDPALPAESLLLLSPGGPGMPPLWVTGGLIAACLAALLMRRNRMVIAIGWGVALFGVLVAILVSRTPVTSINGDTEAPAWPGVPLAFAATGMLVVAALTADRIVEFRAAGGLRRIAALLVAVVAFSTPLLAAGMWVTEGVTGPISGNVRDVIPALAADGARDGRRILLLRSEDGGAGGLTFTVLSGRTPVIGETDIPSPAGPRDRVGVAAAGLASGRGGDDARVLAAHGVRFVVVVNPVSPEVGRALDSQPALARMSLSRRLGVWRLTQPVATPPLPQGDPWRSRWLWIQGLLVLLVAVLAAPGSRAADREIVPQELPQTAREMATR
ncbi:glycosyltransferase family 2 protein [Planomonospora sp. ID67723]|uniref:glycosyltransferase family 2 protein n=1 Tax=Planomonospora sp. ID67723 TaxID=2738134 RepID=UPI0018C40218|nr:glycosyltransferase family 2 protein [Planomonospora sp. ID67723]MBG0828050.1 glycosyltransferase family 2 protein [Planomonospora sp. ID67723]